LRTVYGAERVVDQLAVGRVSAPPNWNEHVARLIGPNLKLVTRGQLQVDGNSVSLRGDVASEAQKQQIAGELAMNLDTSYTVNNGLRVAVSEQGMLDAALADRIIEFESGKASAGRFRQGHPRPDERRAAAPEGQEGGSDRPHRQRRLARRQPLAEPGARRGGEGLRAGRGVHPDMVSVSGEGPDRPVADNRTPEGRARNRRIEFKAHRIQGIAVNSGSEHFSWQWHSLQARRRRLAFPSGAAANLSADQLFKKVL
jgi:OOP family OmpA-OmpF porin